MMNVRSAAFLFQACLLGVASLHMRLRYIARAFKNMPEHAQHPLTESN